MSKMIFALLLAAGGYLTPPPVVHTERPEVYKLTAYTCYDWACLTASGVRAGPGTIAINHLPFGTMVSIEGLGEFEVRDRGTMVGNWADVWLPSLKEAKEFGVQHRQVRILR